MDSSVNNVMTSDETLEAKLAYATQQVNGILGQFSGGTWVHPVLKGVTPVTRVSVAREFFARLHLHAASPPSSPTLQWTLLFCAGLGARLRLLGLRRMRNISPLLSSSSSSSSSSPCTPVPDSQLALSLDEVHLIQAFRMLSSFLQTEDGAAAVDSSWRFPSTQPASVLVEFLIKTMIDSITWTDTAFIQSMVATTNRHHLLPIQVIESVRCVSKGRVDLTYSTDPVALLLLSPWCDGTTSVRLPDSPVKVAEADGKTKQSQQQHSANPVSVLQTTRLVWHGRSTWSVNELRVLHNEDQVSRLCVVVVSSYLLLAEWAKVWPGFLGQGFRQPSSELLHAAVYRTVVMDDKHELNVAFITQPTQDSANQELRCSPILCLLPALGFLRNERQSLSSVSRIIGTLAKSLFEYLHYGQQGSGQAELFLSRLEAQFSPRLLLRGDPLPSASTSASGPSRTEAKNVPFALPERKIKAISIPPSFEACVTQLLTVVLDKLEKTLNPSRCLPTETKTQQQQQQPSAADLSPQQPPPTASSATTCSVEGGRTSAPQLPPAAAAAAASSTERKGSKGNCFRKRTSITVSSVSWESLDSSGTPAKKKAKHNPLPQNPAENDMIT